MCQPAMEHLPFLLRVSVRRRCCTLARIVSDGGVSRGLWYHQVEALQDGLYDSNEDIDVILVLNGGRRKGKSSEEPDESEKDVNSHEAPKYASPEAPDVDVGSSEQTDVEVDEPDDT